MRRTSTQPRLGLIAPPLERAEAGAPSDYSGLSRADLAAMAEAGQEVERCRRVLAKSGDNIVSDILRGQGTFYEWTHYPEGDVYDFESHAQYYYHAHPAGERPGEHGHFHTFLRQKGMPKGVRPALIRGFVPPPEPDDALGHLVAISMDDRGNPIQLFTTNRWVTAEVWYGARDVIAMLDRFEIELAKPSWPVNRWITAMVRLFRPQIELLLLERDRAIAEWQRRHPKVDVFEDRRLEVASALEITVEGQMQRVLGALKRSRR
ncbi:MAG TPA: hypothetical protein VI113_09720 [Alphaproteobacteria bacterium]